MTTPVPYFQTDDVTLCSPDFDDLVADNPYISPN
jgi:hypothetical protein